VPSAQVMYESAKLQHGRPLPLPGENAAYANMFVHYMPQRGYSMV
jgi:hypothetical protein